MWSLAAYGCAIRYQALPVDPGVTFAAHDVHDGVVIDRMTGAAPAVASIPAVFRLHGEPNFTVPSLSGGTEGVWVPGPGRAVARQTASPESAIVGTIRPTWENNTIRLTIEPSHGEPLRSEVFEREDVGGGISELSRLAQQNIDLYGTYRAALRTADGKAAGWLRVSVGLRQPAHTIYEAVFPPEIDEGLAVATTEALGAEIDWIEGHAYDVYSLNTP